MDELKEKIYEFSDLEPFEEIENGLGSFFNDIIIRKRGTLFYDEFRSIIMVLSNKCLAKACERYGMASHNHSAINLVRYANNDDFYFSEEDESSPFSYIHEQKIVREKSLNFRISASSITFLINIDLPIKISKFQLMILRLVIKYIRTLKTKEVFSNYEINIWDYNGKHIYSSDNDSVDKILSKNYEDQLVELTIRSKK